MITSWYPSAKAVEVGKKYIEIRKENVLDRSVGKRVVPVAVRVVKDGIRNTSLYEAKPGKYEELLATMTKTMLKFGEIEGYEYEMETLMSGNEAMPLIGMSMPE